MHNQRCKTDDSGGTRLLPKRTKTIRPIENNERCKLALTVRVGVELDVFYFKCGFGNCWHSHHPRLTCSEITLKSKVVDEHIKKVVELTGEVPLSKSWVTDIMNSHYDFTIENSTMQYKMKEFKNLAISRAGFDLKLPVDSLLY